MTEATQRVAGRTHAEWVEFAKRDDAMDNMIPSDLRKILAAFGPAAPVDRVSDYATRLFDLHGFMLLESYRGKPAVTVTFPDMKEAQQFHNTLVELSQHRVPSAEGSDNG